MLPQGVTGKDVIIALCGILSNDEVLNHAIEFTGSEDTMRSLPVDARLTIANVSYVSRPHSLICAAFGAPRHVAEVQPSWDMFDDSDLISGEIC